ncbi:MAG TPA: 2-dehydro-3-deoxy-D-gluconate 5-dehydrogenase KduD [Phnomibacter sp.]|nr:2-dehydro-3-deoxy-D-gluconate 5-dehydrogenase KduD [Phnomibacter sp.]
MKTLELFSLQGKLAVVTGCDTGLGQGMAVALAEAGADIIGASITPDANDTKNAVEALGRKFTYHSVDISDRTQLYAFINTTISSNKRIDILVNNAGIILRKPAAEHPDEYWDKVIDINLNAQFIIGREFGRHMIEQGGGKMIFTCSLLSFQGGINVPGYTASKSAVAGLVRAFANEWGNKGICVNGITPGYIATNNTAALREDPERSKAILDRIPVGRWGLPQDFKGPVTFLASSASDYVNGTILFVDGGWMAR